MLNSKQSNGPWLGGGGKREGLEAHDVLLLNRELLKTAEAAWTDDAIRLRSGVLARLIVEIWPVPSGHRSDFSRERSTPSHKVHKVDLSDLINDGKLSPGMSLFPRQKKFSNEVATLLPDGRIDVDGASFATPSRAAAAIRGKPTNGWWFFLVDQASRRSLRAVWRDYVTALAVDIEDDEAEDESDDGEA